MTRIFPHENKVGGFSENDGTIDFYSRINCLINKDSVVLDYGAGRGAWSEDDCIYRKQIRSLKGKAKKVYACDPDKAVYQNKNVDEILSMNENIVNAPNEFFDLIFADYVLEHIESPKDFSSEIDRLLKPGGWLCARTPHKYNLISFFGRLIKNKYHKNILKYAQLNRKDVDIFPTFYRLNSINKIKSSFPFYADKSFIFRADSSYFFGKKYIYHLQKFINYFLISILVGNLFIYIQKPYDN